MPPQPLPPGYKTPAPVRDAVPYRQTTTNYTQRPSDTGETRPLDAYVALTKDPANLNPFDPATSRLAGGGSLAGQGGGSGSGSGGGGYGGGSAGMGMNLDPIYAALKEELTKQRLAAGQGIDQSIAATKGFYGDATGDMYDAYQNSRNDLEGRAGNLGVDFDNSSIGLGWDAALRRLQEMSDSNMTSDLTYFEKMRGLSDLAYDSLLQGVAQDKLNRQMGLASGGGSSYRGGGGGGSSSGSTSNKDTATQTSTINNVGDLDLLNELRGTSPIGALLYNAAYTKAGYDPNAASQALYNSSWNKPIPSVGLLSPNASINKLIGTLNTQKSNSYGAAQAALQKLAGVFGNPAIGQKVTSTGSQSWKS